MKEIYAFITEQEQEAGVTRYGEKIVNGRVNGFKTMVTKNLTVEYKNNGHPFKKFI